jgi:hypothetical protein
MRHDRRWISLVAALGVGSLYSLGRGSTMDVDVVPTQVTTRMEAGVLWFQIEVAEVIRSVSEHEGVRIDPFPEGAKTITGQVPHPSKGLRVRIRTRSGKDVDVLLPSPRSP